MTSRLKKRVEQAAAGGDGKGLGNLLESFVTYGTALPSLASTSKDSNEFVPLWEQTVTDEQGRRRLHGAFTGGFSAGYFNTVGSKEGWTPKAFTSSRSTRAAKDGGQSTEELAKGLMDDEDLAEMQSSRTLQTSSAYASAPPSAYDPLTGESGPPSLPPTASLASLIQPASGRIGLKLMRRMGWREGQGVGPRVTFAQRQAMARDLGVPSGVAEDEDGDGEASKHYYAPLDRPLTSLTAIGVATDRGWGLGYLPAPGVAQSAKMSSGKTAGAWSGVDMDEDEVYNMEDGGFGPAGDGKRPKWVVDLEQDDGEDGRYQIKSTGGKERGDGVKKPSKPLGTFHDNTPVLTGFTILHEPNSCASTSQLPPPPPRGWTANPQRFLAPPSTTSGDLKGKGRQLDADQRGDLLGEPQPAPLPKSVFDYMSSKSRERLAAISANTSDYTPGTSSNSTPLAGTARAVPVAPVEPDAPLYIPLLDAPTALAALSGFQPFSPASSAADPVRQARYTLYLQFQADLLPPSVTPSTLPFGPRKLAAGRVQTIKELNIELDDYARAARVFKPVSGMLAGRFTSTVSGGILEAPKVAPGLSQPKPKVVGAESTAGEPKLIEHLTPAQTAARAGMFGRLTRTTEEFRPAKLVCKRFAVRNPYPDAAEEEEEAGGSWKEAGKNGGPRKPAGDILGKESMEQLMKSSGFRKFEKAAATFEESVLAGLEPAEPLTSVDMLAAPARPREELKTLATIGLGDDEAQGAATLTYTKAPADIFAAVFAESDDEDDETEDEPDTSMVPQRPPLVVPVLPRALIEPASVVAAPREPSPPEVSLSADMVASYKPSFVPSISRTSKGDADSTTTTSKKKSSKRKSSKPSLSFDVDDGEDPAETFERKVVKKRKPKIVAVPEAIEEDEWAVVEDQVHASILEAGQATAKGRARAADLFE